MKYFGIRKKPEPGSCADLISILTLNKDGNVSVEQFGEIITTCESLDNYIYFESRVECENYLNKIKEDIWNFIEDRQVSVFFFSPDLALTGWCCYDKSSNTLVEVPFPKDADNTAFQQMYIQDHGLDFLEFAQLMNLKCVKIFLSKDIKQIEIKFFDSEKVRTFDFDSAFIHTDLNFFSILAKYI